MARRGGHPVSEIVLDRVSKAFAGRSAVENLSLTIARGEIVALVGRTGAGKSTALSLMMGAFPPDRGHVRVAGLDPHAEFGQLAGRLAVSFQTDRLLPWRRALDNVSLGLQILGVERGERERRARLWLDRVKMTGAERKYPHELSGGMRQRVSFARALAVEPAIVLLDESFGQLDEVTSRELRRDFAELVRGLGTTSVLVTHRLEEALEMADRVVVLGAPARVLAEIRTDATERADPVRLGALRRAVAEILEKGDHPAT
jgi:NitT/TauT family transport system ATP-binding protein